MAEKPEVIQGKQVVGYFRILEKDHQENALPFLWEDTSSMNVSRDTDTKTTKSGEIVTSSGLETEIEHEFADNLGRLSDEIDLAIFKDKPVEVWRINLQRKNPNNPRYVMGYYIRGRVSESDLSADNDDTASRDVTITGYGTPQKGWVYITDDMQDQIDYGFRGISKLTNEDEKGGGYDYSAEVPAEGDVTE